MNLAAGLCNQPNNGVTPDDFFALQGERANAAKTVCMQCPLYFDCAEYAITQGIEYGIWGGTTGAERARIWKKAGKKPDLFFRSYDDHVNGLMREYRARAREGVA